MDIIERYEAAALRALQEANENGDEEIATVTVLAHIGGASRFFLIPRATLAEVRKVIINQGGSYRATFA